jgi:putative transposase
MSLWKLYYHFVWATYQRLPLITPVLEEPLYQFIRQKTDELGGYVHAIGGISDHAHLIVSIPPSIALSHYAEGIKGSSSRYLNAHHANPTARFK